MKVKEILEILLENNVNCTEESILELLDNIGYEKANVNTEVDKNDIKKLSKRYGVDIKPKKVVKKAEPKAEPKKETTEKKANDNKDKKEANTKEVNNNKNNAQEIITNPDIDVIVELMGGLEPAGTYIKTAIEHGKHDLAY